MKEEDEDSAKNPPKGRSPQAVVYVMADPATYNEGRSRAAREVVRRYKGGAGEAIG
jgi:hypothetical protein